jgi:hypothetical protein
MQRPKRDASTQCTNDKAKKIRELEKRFSKFKKFHFFESDGFKQKISLLENEKTYYLEEETKHSYKINVSLLSVDLIKET